MAQLAKDGAKHEYPPGCHEFHPVMLMVVGKLVVQISRLVGWKHDLGLGDNILINQSLLLPLPFHHTHSYFLTERERERERERESSLTLIVDTSEAVTDDFLTLKMDSPCPLSL